MRCCNFVQAFDHFAAANEGVFKQLGVSHEDALTKMRLMALLGLGSQASSVTFQDVQVWHIQMPIVGEVCRFSPSLKLPLAQNAPECTQPPEGSAELRHMHAVQIVLLKHCPLGLALAHGA